MRAWRNTVVRFGLLSVPVSLSPLVGGSPCEGHTHEIGSGERVKRAWTTNGKDIVPNEETETRYATPSGEAVALDASVSGTTGIDVESAVHVGDVDASLFDSSYAVNAGKDAPKALATLCRVLQESGRILVGTARFTESASEKSVVLRYSSLTKGVVLDTLHPLERVRIEDARKEASGMETPSEAEIRQGETFVDSLPDVLPALRVTDEKDDAIRGALAALVSSTGEDTENESSTEDVDSATDLVSSFVAEGYEAAKARKDAKDTETVAS